MLAALGLAMLMAPTAIAHSVNGSGDCDRWTINFDGTFGAKNVKVDGEIVRERQDGGTLGNPGNPFTRHFPDDSADTERTFRVVWVKVGQVNKVINITLVRDLSGCNQATTTTLPEETTSTTSPPDSTTTSVVTEDTTTTTIITETTTTQSPPTTTTEAPTDSSSTTTPTTQPAPTTTQPEVEVEVKGEELPFTGIEDWLLPLGVALLMAGATVLFAINKKETT
jgi:hypothetical protein